MRPFSPKPIILGLVAMLIFLAANAAAIAADSRRDDDVCDITADYHLGLEDYAEAARLHRRIVAAHPGDALAHYHLGFAYGMLGQHRQELAEYRRAARLGIRKWDLFLNLGRAYLEGGNLEAATEALKTAASLGRSRPEARFNLGLAYAKRGMFEQAKQEIAVSLRLDPGRPDARNALGVIFAEQGDYARARQIWSDLARTSPGFGPARRNLAILDRHDPLSTSALPRASTFRPGRRINCAE